MLRFTTLFARPVIVLAAASAAATLAAPALAAPADAAPTMLVRLRAADLSSNAATTTVHNRIAIAARQVCSPDGNSVQAHMAAKECYAKAVRSAESQLAAERERAKGRLQTLATAAR